MPREKSSTLDIACWARLSALGHFATRLLTGGTNAPSLCLEVRKRLGVLLSQ